MTELSEFAIELSKKKVLLVLIGSVALVVIGVCILLLDESTIRSLPRHNNPLFIRSIGLISILLFGWGGVYGFRKLLDKSPGLVLNSSGIVDNSSGLAVGFIPWSEILSVEVIEISKQKMLVIQVRDPKKYIDKGGRLRWTMNVFNYKLTGSPIFITSGSLKTNFSDLYSLFRMYMEKYGNS